MMLIINNYNLWVIVITLVPRQLSGILPEI
jgi:hypothetical protein